MTLMDWLLAITALMLIGLVLCLALVQAMESTMED